MSVFCLYCSIAADYERHSFEAQKDTNHHLANPVNAYLLVKRLTTDWVKVQEMIDSRSNIDGKFVVI